MTDKLQKAIFNNNGLYEAIFSNHNLQPIKASSIWYSLEKTPPLYSNLVTFSEDWLPDDIFRSIELNYEKERWSGWSIKDSFNVLDLSKYGFQKLFDAQWIYLEAAKFKEKKTNKNLRYEIVNGEDLLSMWRIAWDSDEQLGKEIFNAKLLDNPKVCFVAGFERKQIVSGCFVNKTDDVLGVSNFFAPDENTDYWSDILGFILDSIERIDIVGYEQKEVASKLRSFGFESVGNLSVWLKKRDS